MFRVAKPKPKATALWFTGICDELFVKIAIWYKAYWFGDTHSTRKFLEKVGQVVDKPVKTAHHLPFREVELEHLIRILEALRPRSAMLEEWQKIRKLWKSGKPIRTRTYERGYWSKILLPVGLHRVVIVAFYDEHVKELLEILNEAKTGQKAATLDRITAEKKSEGKDIFEE